MKIGTAEPNSTFLAQGAALKSLLERTVSGVAVEVVHSPSASIENAGRLHAGEIDFGFMAANWIGLARAGAAPFEQPMDLRVAAPMNAGPMFFITRADRPLARVSDLRGKRVAVGLETSGIAQHARSMLGALGIGMSDCVPVHVGLANGAALLARGEIDAQLQCPMPNKVMSELIASTTIRVVPFATSELDAVLANAPAYRRTVIAKDAIPGNERDLPQPAVVNLLMTHRRASDAMVRDVVEAIARHAAELERIEPLFAGLAGLFERLRSDGAAALAFGGVPIHPGALQAYRQNGLLP
jgi:TRAP transporter TAXI family solute receptor